MKRAALIVNPYSTHVTRERVAEVESVLRERMDVQTEYTHEKGHATQLARASAAEVDAIIVFSGDGTYNEALNGADGSVPFGFLPGGGTSVLPRVLGVPRDPVEAARRVASALATGGARRISLGAVNGRRFSFSAGIGFEGEAVRMMDELGRSPGGARPSDLTFARMFLRLLLQRRGRYDPQLEIEGIGRAAFILVANTDPYSYAGRVPLRVAPAARFEEGLDFVAPERVRARDVPRLVTYLVRGRGQLEARDVLTGHNLDRISVRCDRPLPLQVDGEDLGDVDYAVFEAIRDAVSVLV